MKLKLALATAFLAIGVSSVQAADTPDLLSSISTSSVQTMSVEEAAKARGEYLSCHLTLKKISLGCSIKITKKTLSKYVKGGGTYTYNLKLFRAFGYNVAR